MNMATTAQTNTTQVMDRLQALKDGCCLISVKVRGCCGEKSLNSKKIVIDGQEIESQLMKGTNFNWFPQESLTFKGSTARAVERLLASMGIKVAGGATLLPVSKLDALYEQLEAIEGRWHQKLNDVTTDFQNLLDEHIAANPEVESLIREYAWDATAFKSSFVFKVSPPLAFAPADPEDIDEVFEETIGIVYEDVAKMATDIYRKSFYVDGPGKTKQLREKISQSVVNSSIRQLMDKLISLSFLDNSIGNIIDAAKAELAELPKNGYIEGNDFARLQHFVLALGNEEMIRAFAEGQQPLFSFGLDQEDDEPEPEQTATQTPTNFSLFDVIEDGHLIDDDTESLADWGAGL